uniref:Reticulocalbin-3 n=1 Tax=Ciona savignyi TaxID=51511 RepID=H2ZJY9_CIOSA
MILKVFLLLFVCYVGFAAVAKKDRVLDQKLSDKEPGSPDYDHEDSNKQFLQHDTNKDGKIDWEEYKESTYGFMKDHENSDDEDGLSYKKMIDRDQSRFNAADSDQNKECTPDEFKAFLHPEEFDHMKDIVTRETLDDIDK